MAAEDAEPYWDGYVAPAFASVARTFAKMFTSPKEGGGSLCVRWRGETVVDVWKGFSDAAGTRPWTRDTLAISFSTTKGVASTVIHRLADRGLIGYDEPVAAYWPKFANGAKGRITVRELLSHQAGLSSVRAVASDATAMLDHLAMEDRLAMRVPDGGRGSPAYHALTYGWLVAGLARHVTGKGMAALVREEIADPLGVDGLHIGMPPGGPAAVAHSVGSHRRLFWLARQVLQPAGSRFVPSRRALDALFIPGFDRLFEGPAPPILGTEMPAANGVFSASALCSMYTALANGGAVDGVRLLSPETVRQLGRVQTRDRDGVLGFPMRWRLGYHHAITTGRPSRFAFGHYGFGGSGGWADPVSGVSLGFVTNKLAGVTTPMGDMGLFRLGGVARAAARRAAAEDAAS
jgi:CubicO group peptidase (beta-lactamase class C family)